MLVTMQWAHWLPLIPAQETEASSLVSPASMKDPVPTTVVLFVEGPRVLPYYWARVVPASMHKWGQGPSPTLCHPSPKSCPTSFIQ